MSYALVIPLEYLEKLAMFKKWFQQSIRSQIFEVIEKYIDDLEVEIMEKMVCFFSLYFSV